MGVERRFGLRVWQARAGATAAARCSQPTTQAMLAKEASVRSGPAGAPTAYGPSSYETAAVVTRLP